MKELKRFGDIMKVKEFVEKLKQEFKPTPLEPILTQIDLVDNSVHLTTNLNINESSGQGGCNLSLTAEVTDWKEVRSFEFSWDTSSNHTVVIILEEGYYNLYIGPDKSQNFYPLVSELVNQVSPS